MTQQKWRDERDYHYLREAVRAGFAWEFVRRNADYRRMAAAAPRPAEESVGKIALLTGGATALRWGLLFRRRP